MSINSLGYAPQLNQTSAFDSSYPMSVNDPSATSYLTAPRLEQDTFHKVGEHNKRHRNRYQEALAKQHEAPWYQRIGVNAIIFPAAIVVSALIMNRVGKLPFIQKAIDHPKWWVSAPANFAKFVGEWAIMDAIIEFATIGFWSHFL
jgi:hypothetical protein